MDKIYVVMEVSIDGSGEDVDTNAQSYAYISKSAAVSRLLRDFEDTKNQFYDEYLSEEDKDSDEDDDWDDNSYDNIGYYEYDERTMSAEVFGTDDDYDTHRVKFYIKECVIS